MLPRAIRCAAGCAVNNLEACQSRLVDSGRDSRGCKRGRHRFKQRKSKGCSHSLQYSTSRQMFPGYKHWMVSCSGSTCGTPASKVLLCEGEETIARDGKQRPRLSRVSTFADCAAHADRTRGRVHVQQQQPCDRVPARCSSAFDREWWKFILNLQLLSNPLA